MINTYYVQSITREKYEKTLESCKQLYPKISDNDKIYIGGGVSITKDGWCSVPIEPIKADSIINIKEIYNMPNPKNTTPATPQKRRLYTKAECGRLFTFYTNRPENEHNDSHPRLIKFAAELGRTPGSVGIQLRVIKRLCTTGKKQRGLSHSSKTLRDVVSMRRTRKAKLI